jgi:hypothetical protein
MLRTTLLSRVNLWCAPALLASLIVTPSPAVADQGAKDWAWTAWTCDNSYCPAPCEVVEDSCLTLPLCRGRPIDYYVQMYSARSRGRSLSVKQKLNGAFGSILGCCALELRRIDLGLMGPHWSIWAGPVKTKGLAIELCRSLKLEGLHGCVVEPQ